jgi:hypothetical protein
LDKLGQLKKPFLARMSLVIELNWEKRLMRPSTIHKRHTRRGFERDFLQEALQQFLTPHVIKQGHQAWQTKHHNCSWSLKALLWVMLLMTWGKGDSQNELFLGARAYFISKHQHEKRPGATWEGFRQALRRLPMSVFRALAAGIREQIGGYWIDALRIGGWLPIGCDGSRLACPRTAQLERCMGQASKDDSAPMVYLSALVLLPLGLLWSWRLDKGTGSEHKHLRQMLPTLPEKSLLVADAGYLSYALYRSIIQAQQGFLIRMSSRAYLLTEQNVPLVRFQEGWVWYWPGYAQRKGQLPIRARLLRVAGKGGDVWLLTNLDCKTLSRRRAARIYRWRWRNEGMFRTYKTTLQKIKLQHRTTALIFREAEASLLALQLLLATAVVKADQDGSSSASPRQMLLRIRGAMSNGIAELGPRQRHRYRQALEDIHREGPHRTSSKTRRAWPRRKEHKPPKPPKLRRLSAKQNYRLRRMLQVA